MSSAGSPGKPMTAGGAGFRDFIRNRFLALTLGVLALDLLTKHLVNLRIAFREPVEVIPGFLRISHVLNSGVAFGLFDDLQWVWKPVILGSLALSAVVVILLYGGHVPPDRVMLRLALAVTLGGVIGNFLDRIVDGKVIDFIEVHLLDRYYWPTFNVADSAITVGIALLVIDTLKNPDGGKPPSPEPAGKT